MTELDENPQVTVVSTPPGSRTSAPESKKRRSQESPSTITTQSNVSDLEITKSKKRRSQEPNIGDQEITPSDDETPPHGFKPVPGHPDLLYGSFDDRPRWDFKKSRHAHLIEETEAPTFETLAKRGRPHIPGTYWRNVGEPSEFNTIPDHMKHLIEFVPMPGTPGNRPGDGHLMMDKLLGKGKKEGDNN